MSSNAPLLYLEASMLQSNDPTRIDRLFLLLTSPPLQGGDTREVKKNIDSSSPQAPQNDSGRGPQQTSLKTIVHRIGSVSIGSRLSRVILSVSEESMGCF
ncbi:protein of unknown function [Nitrospina watsonii]|uniref:Uncharacterized protein n=1 Tax=Nitrospina watsonii TaxID=1323948 RepID=A0ABM9HAH7_9BACT|nr:protein of unknown function [Nitrospina watsonii]